MCFSFGAYCCGSGLVCCFDCEAFPSFSSGLCATAVGTRLKWRVYSSGMGLEVALLSPDVIHCPVTHEESAAHYNRYTGCEDYLDPKVCTFTAFRALQILGTSCFVLLGSRWGPPPRGPPRREACVEDDLLSLRDSQGRPLILTAAFVETSQIHRLISDYGAPICRLISSESHVEIELIMIYTYISFGYIRPTAVCYQPTEVYCKPTTCSTGLMTVVH